MPVATCTLVTPDGKILEIYYDIENQDNSIQVKAASITEMDIENYITEEKQ